MIQEIDNQEISAHETGKLGIKQLKRFWGQSMQKRDPSLTNEKWQKEWPLNIALLAALGLGLEPTLMYLFKEQPSFDELENWIINTAGRPSAININRYNHIINGKQAGDDKIEPFLTREQEECWKKDGYVILKNVISQQQCDETIAVICDFLNIKRNDPETWYNPHPARQGIMVQLFQHPVLQRNREAPAIRKAYEQLWQRTDIWLNTDRVSFNPPQTENWHFPGPKLHWDCKLQIPVTFGTQGILYLADTEATQGAFTLVPGFQYKIDNWLASVPAGTDPQKMDLYALGPKPIVAGAGDFIIWHHALPHGSGPNSSANPRFVQYINMAPADANF